MIELLHSLSPAIKAGVAEDWMWDTEVYPEEEALIARAVMKRKREFRAGRHTAHKLLETLGYEQFRLVSGDHRQPLWPDGIVGSVSHTQGYCVCAVAPQQHITGIGIDVEQTQPVDEASLPLICNRSELRMVELLQPESAFPLCKLIFSAKECVHKVYYPLNGYTLDFLDAEISVNIEQRSFTAKILNPEKNPPHPIRVLDGHFHFDEQYVYTAIIK